MKTAMQELQEWMTENHFKVTLGFLDQIEYCKQKEKQQIIEACNHWKEQKGTCFDDDFIWTGEEYYNQKYNQNL